MNQVPNPGAWEVCQESAEIKAQLTQELGGEDRSFVGVRANTVFEALGLKSVVFAELPENVRNKVIEAVRKYRGSRYAIPYVQALSGEKAWPEKVQLAASDDYSTLYFYMDPADRNPYGHVSWSNLRDWGAGYEIRGINHDSYTGEVAHCLALHEAQVRVASRTREDVGEVTGQ
ncbi:hypothetical protein KJ657_04165 [Patescibacteria group bacterium]|nr:hypothetical protein [Patescibacteria group bacterium]MBU1016259.1 hypothetical protein [Patescibacteria group bacterium]MBU1685491.1 hypothetical protein [Patescibacteria group bacterium]MBU1939117.1 hypothetical protein [Patescibacteria group bacterium]